jgi:hypothetical protein
MVVDNDVEYLAEDLGIVENITLQDKDLFVKKNINVILFLEFFKSMGFISLISVKHGSRQEQIAQLALGGGRSLCVLSNNTLVQALFQNSKGPGWFKKPDGDPS